jgi:hypothetical protein
MRATLLGSVLVVVVTAAAATPAEAQLGGMIRRAKEAAEKKAAPEPATTTANPFSDPAVVFITQDQLARFEKALQYEIDQRNALRKAAAGAKSQAEYQACAQGVAISPEMMKIVQDMADSSANGTTEQLIKAQQKMQTDMAAILAKRCGPDPQANQGSRFERLRQIEAEASDIAMPAGFTATSGAQGRLEERTTPYGNVALSYRASRPYFPSFEARAQAASAHPFARHYGMLKERIPVFCATDKKMSAPTTITVGNQKMTIVKVRSAQGGLEYAFRQDEVDALNAGCASVMAKMNALFDTQNQ